MSIRYKYSPQLKAYDQIMNNWKSYTMFIQPKNFKSNIFNTDYFGLRFTQENKLKYSLFEQNNLKKKEEIAIFGGSTAFGVGSTEDSKTISSVISNNLNYKVYNLGCRAYNNFQELILFNEIYYKFTNLKYLVFVSGINDIFLSYYIEKNSNLESPPYYFQSEFDNRMNYPHNSLYKKILFNVLPRTTRSKINWVSDNKEVIFKKVFKNKDFNTNTTKYNWRNNYEKNLRLWNMLSNNMGFKIIFVLQPFYEWVNKKPSKEELEIFRELKKNNSQKVVAALNSIKKNDYDIAINFFKDNCRKNNILFLDMNEDISKSECNDKWFFVDSIHLNDYGYEYTAKKVINLINA